MIRKLRIKVPGSSANIGPGFDALALALNRYCQLEFDVLSKDDKTVPLVTVKGAPVDVLPQDDQNLIYSILSQCWKSDPESLSLVRISIDTNIPLGKGLGSSAAAIMGAVCAAAKLSSKNDDRMAMLKEATAFEGHPDNVAASLLGGLVVCSNGERRGDVVAQSLPWPEDWCPIVAVPTRSLSTKESRAVLPTTVPRHDAVSNVQNVSTLIAAVIRKDAEALKAALHDRLHEPYREMLVPELKSIRRALDGVPVLGCVLSGAGPSVLTLVARRHRTQALQCINDWASKQSQPVQVLDLQVDQEGLQVTDE